MMTRGSQSARGAATAPALASGMAVRGQSTVLDAMLDAALGDASSAPGRPPLNASGRPGRHAKSASPRPERWRPVDCVKLAKSELSQIGDQQASVGAFSKIRLSKLPAALDGGDSAEHPGLHDGFYDFAAAVVRPQPTARQYSLQLRSQLEDGLREAQAIGEVGEGRVGLRSGMVLAAERSKREVEVCIATLEKFVQDTTTDSKEREAMLQCAHRASKEAMTKVLNLMKTCCIDLEDADESKAGLESSLHQLDEDNIGLRHVMKQMLATEDELRQKVMGLTSEIAGVHNQLDEKDHTISELGVKLDETMAELQALRDEQARGRPTKDQCVSPMMGFSTFMMSTDPLPMASDDSANREGIAGASFSHQASTVPRRKTVTSRKSDAPRTTLAATVSGKGHRGSVNPASMVSVDVPGSDASQSPIEQQRSSRRNSRSGSTGATGSPSGDQEDHREQRSRSMEVANAPHVLTFSAFGNTSSKDNMAEASREGSKSSRDYGEIDDTTAQTAPPLLVTSFPALLPFVDFHMLDPGLDKAEADALTLNSEHLQKHLVMLQGDYQKEVSQTEELQHSVDTCLERILVWLQAVHDSLQDINSNAIQQDIRALTTLRNAVEWLAKHPCKEWTSQAGHLDEVLDEHEAELRGHLAIERPHDTEMEELRKSIVQQRQRVQDLSDQLLEARASVGGPVRSQRRPVPHSSTRRVSSFREGGTELRGVHHVEVQCDLVGTSAFLTEAIDEQISSPRDQSKVSASSRMASKIGSKTPRSRSSSKDAQEAFEGSQALDIAKAAQPFEEAIPANMGLDAPLAVEDAPAEAAVAADEACGAPAADSQPALLPSGKAAVEITARESKRMLLLRCLFVEAIDFTAVPVGSRVLLSHTVENASGDVASGRNEDNLLGLKQLRALIIEVYAQKKADDVRRDKISEARRPLYEVLQEHIRRTHGVKKVVHQKSWQLVESLVQHGVADKTVDMFSEFLDGTRDLDELSFFLYCSSVFTAGVTEESHLLPPTRFAEGLVSYTSALAIADLLFGDLPKALAVMKMELEKVSVMDPDAEHGARTRLAQIANEGTSMTSRSFTEGVAAASLCVLTDHIYEILLEGWRMSALLLDQSIPSFSWRRNILAFVQSDASHRGWLDPHEVKQAEVRRLQIEPAASDGTAVMDRTSIGAFVFRCVQHCSSTRAGIPVLAPPATVAPGGAGARPRGAAERRRLAQKKAEEAALQVTSTAFESIKKSLEVYLTWMMHSDELRDLAVYRSVKAQIFGFQQASGTGSAVMGTHHLRSLLLLLLAHQFDVQHQKQDLGPEQLEWELRSLLVILRECWKRGATSDDGPDFGPELEAVGDAAGQACREV